jgi:hypothetical protein
VHNGGGCEHGTAFGIGVRSHPCDELDRFCTLSLIALTGVPVRTSPSSARLLAVPGPERAAAASLHGRPLQNTVSVEWREEHRVWLNRSLRWSVTWAAVSDGMDHLPRHAAL